jgi:hypothetical protein
MKQMFLSFLGLSILLFVGCAVTPQETAREIESLKTRIVELEEVVKERDVLLQEKLELRKGMDQLENEIKEQTRRREGIKAVLFGGDIIYEIDAGSYRDYRECLRFRSLRDEVFAKSLADYEQGQGGDMQMMALLKEIDSTRDRFISSEEAADFVSSEQKIYYGQEK